MWKKHNMSHGMCGEVTTIVYTASPSWSPCVQLNSTCIHTTCMHRNIWRILLYQAKYPCGAAASYFMQHPMRCFWEAVQPGHEGHEGNRSLCPPSNWHSESSCLWKPSMYHLGVLCTVENLGKGSIQWCGRNLHAYLRFISRVQLNVWRLLSTVLGVHGLSMWQWPQNDIRTGTSDFQYGKHFEVPCVNVL